MLKHVTIAAFAWMMVPSHAVAKDAVVLPATLELKGLEGGTLGRKDVQGKVVVMQFWASWCVGCDRTMGELQEMTKDLKGVIFVPVSVDESVEAAQSFFKFRPDVKPLQARSYLDVDAKLASQFGVAGVPTIALINRDGKLLELTLGHASKERYLEIRKLIDRERGLAH